ncbi:MAG TPA: hypothetical protein VFE24_12610 [Pirellulales bacterium]|jgi:hypothetical protein|nr:hypothetical protein [Pirellulales bacterium]
MANIYTIVFAVVGVLVTHTCLLVWTALILPGPVERARKRLEARPRTTWLTGLCSCVLYAGLAVAFFVFRADLMVVATHVLQFLGEKLHVSRFYNDAWILSNLLLWVLGAPLFAAFTVGGAAFAQLFAIRARPLMDRDRPLVGLIGGSFCTTAAYFLPLIGWFVYLPLVGLLSLGAGLSGLRRGFGATPADARSATKHRGDAATADL